MKKFKFNTKRKKINFFTDKEEIFSTDILKGAHLEIFSNKKIIAEGCHSIIDYQNDFLKLKLKKGFLCVFGSDFLITTFEDKKIIINGNIISLEFLI